MGGKAVNKLSQLLRNRAISTDEYKMKKSMLYILRFRVSSFNIKPNREPNISKVMIDCNGKIKKGLDTWVKKYVGLCEIKCTSVDYEYFIKNYDYTDLELIDGMEFKCHHGFFDKFTNK